MGYRIRDASGKVIMEWEEKPSQDVIDTFVKAYSGSLARADQGPAKTPGPSTPAPAPVPQLTPPPEVEGLEPGGLAPGGTKSSSQVMPPVMRWAGSPSTMIRTAAAAGGLIGGLPASLLRGVAATGEAELQRQADRELGFERPDDPGNLAKEILQNAGESIKTDYQRLQAALGFREEPKDFRGLVEQALQYYGPGIREKAGDLGELYGMVAYGLTKDPETAALVKQIVAGGGEAAGETLTMLGAGAAEDPTMVVGFLSKLPRTILTTDKIFQAAGATALGGGALEQFGAAHDAFKQGNVKEGVKRLVSAATFSGLARGAADLRGRDAEVAPPAAPAPRETLAPPPSVPDRDFVYPEEPPPPPPPYGTTTTSPDLGPGVPARTDIMPPPPPERVVGPEMAVEAPPGARPVDIPMSRTDTAPGPVQPQLFGPEMDVTLPPHLRAVDERLATGRTGTEALPGMVPEQDLREMRYPAPPEEKAPAEVPPAPEAPAPTRAPEEVPPPPPPTEPPVRPPEPPAAPPVPRRVPRSEIPEGMRTAADQLETEMGGRPPEEAPAPEEIPPPPPTRLETWEAEKAAALARGEAPVLAGDSIPDRRRLVGRGAHGQAEVIFPDRNHADLYKLGGRWKNDYRWTLDRLTEAWGMERQEVLDMAQAYREEVSAGVRELPKDVDQARFEAPPAKRARKEAAAPPPPVEEIPPPPAPAAVPADLALSNLKPRRLTPKQLGGWAGKNRPRQLIATTGPLGDDYHGNGHFLVKGMAPQKVPEGVEHMPVSDETTARMIDGVMKRATRPAEPIGYAPPRKAQQDPYVPARKGMVWLRTEDGEFTAVDSRYYGHIVRALQGKSKTPLKWFVDSEKGQASERALLVFKGERGEAPDAIIMPMRFGKGDVPEGLKAAPAAAEEPPAAGLRPPPETPDEIPAPPTEAAAPAAPPPAAPPPRAPAPPPPPPPTPKPGVAEAVAATYKRFPILKTDKYAVEVKPDDYRGRATPEVEEAVGLVSAIKALQAKVNAGGEKSKVASWKAHLNMLKKVLRDQVPADARAEAREVYDRAGKRHYLMGTQGKPGKAGRVRYVDPSGKSHRAVIKEFSPDGQYVRVTTEKGQAFKDANGNEKTWIPLEELSDGNYKRAQEQLSYETLKAIEALGDIGLDLDEVAEMGARASPMARARTQLIVQHAIDALMPRLTTILGDRPMLQGLKVAFQDISRPDRVTGEPIEVYGRFDPAIREDNPMILNLDAMLRTSHRRGGGGRIAHNIRRTLEHEIGAHATGGQHPGIEVLADGSVRLLEYEGLSGVPTEGPILGREAGSPGSLEARRLQATVSPGQHLAQTGETALRHDPEVIRTMDALEATLENIFQEGQTGAVSRALLKDLGVSAATLGVLAPFYMINPGAGALATLMWFSGLGVMSKSKYSKVSAAADALTRASTAGRFGVAIGNAMNAQLRLFGAAGMHTLSSLAYAVGEMGHIKHLTQGTYADSYAKLLPAWKAALGMPGGSKLGNVPVLGHFAGDLLGAMLSLRRDPRIWDFLSTRNIFGDIPLMHPRLKEWIDAGAANDSALKNLMLSVDAPKDIVDRFFHFTEGTIDQSKIDRLGKVPTELTNLFLVFNAAVDRTTRMMYMNMHLAPLMKKWGAKNFTELFDHLADSYQKGGEFELSKTHQELAAALDTGMTAAFNYSGALRGPNRGTWSALTKLTEGINKLPLPLATAAAGDFALFSNYTLNNVPGVAMQSVPGFHIMAPRFWDSMRADSVRDAAFAAKREIRNAERTRDAAKSRAGELRADADRVAKRNTGEARALREEAKAIEAEAREQLREVKERNREAIKEYDAIRREGYYTRNQVNWEFLGTGMTVMGMMAAWQILRGDDGTGPTEVPNPNEEGKVVDISRWAGPLTVPVVLGRVIGRELLKAKNPEMFPEVGPTPWGGDSMKDLFKALGYRREFSGGGFLDLIFGKSPEQRSNSVNRIVADMMRLYMNQGGWLRDITKGLQGGLENYPDPAKAQEAWVPGESAGRQVVDRAGRAVERSFTSEVLRKPTGVAEAWDKLTAAKRPIQRHPLAWTLTVREQSALTRFAHSVEGENLGDILPSSRQVQWYDDIVMKHVATRYREPGGVFEILEDPSLTAEEKWVRVKARARDINAEAHTAAKREADATGRIVPGLTEILEREREKELQKKDPYLRRKEMMRSILGDIPSPASRRRQMTPREQRRFEQRQKKLIEERGLRPPPDDGGDAAPIQ